MVWFRIGDIFFMVFHTTLILFNLTGWIWRRTRPYNLVTLLLTLGSWVVLGIFYGWGYCPSTDWHFQILRKMGTGNLPDSYILFMIRRITGYSPPSGLVDALTVAGLLLALALSLWLNIRDRYRSRYQAGHSSGRIKTV